MSKNINVVLEGKYKNKKISRTDILILPDDEEVYYPLSEYTISSYSVIDKINKDLYGGKEYLIAVEWKEGGKSLISLNEEYYKTFIISMF